ncbi:MAG: hypothetical protein MJ176_03280 [Treponema sp.]|nr:hypothetical protein [Treponema sp.]
MKVKLWRIEFDMGAERVAYYRRSTVEKLDDEINKLKKECPGYKAIIYQVVDEKILITVSTLL